MAGTAGRTVGGENQKTVRGEVRAMRASYHTNTMLKTRLYGKV